MWTVELTRKASPESPMYISPSSEVSSTVPIMENEVPSSPGGPAGPASPSAPAGPAGPAGPASQSAPAGPVRSIDCHEPEEHAWNPDSDDR